MTDRDLQNLLQELQAGGNGRRLAELIKPNPVAAHPAEPLCIVVYRMAETGFTRLPVVTRRAPGRLVGIIALSDLLKARVHHLEEERRGFGGVWLGEHWSLEPQWRIGPTCPSV